MGIATTMRTTTNPPTSLQTPAKGGEQSPGR